MKSIRGKRRIENNVSGVQEKSLMKPSNKDRIEIKSNVSTGPGVKLRHQRHLLVLILPILLYALNFYKQDR
ncbi:hypothetical protein HU200_014063 [Digitaria exilis]|uniref:Uncharacterized protein n=1 Tax=Digitaria exilis TaxID=1010633 RepID=A0A835BAD8_9POAL|nr:hypothetical protein HU200_039412 [Digitaria exilis]KAF8737626.1 hypothetical protein HU200_014063 [Digitaria exilis]